MGPAPSPSSRPFATLGALVTGFMRISCTLAFLDVLADIWSALWHFSRQSSALLISALFFGTSYEKSLVPVLPHTALSRLGVTIDRYDLRLMAVAHHIYQYLKLGTSSLGSIRYYRDSASVGDLAIGAAKVAAFEIMT